MRRRWAWLALSLLLAGCGLGRAPLEGQLSPPEAEEVAVPPLEDRGPAPELKGEVWLNTEEPLQLAELEGKVVLLEMWTFGCINCRRVIPNLREWHDRYQGDGLVIIGNHYPEFAYEEKLGNLKAAIQEHEIEYAVVQDNSGENWQAYRNRYWPTMYLIDKSGHLRYQHIGEGAYATSEAAIRALLAE